jgi:hypothetical protein
VCAQSTESVVFPKPAGAEMSVSLRANPSSIRLSRRGREIHPARSGGTWSFVLKGVRCWISSHSANFPWGEALAASFFEDDPAAIISASYERSRNQACQTTTSYRALYWNANNYAFQFLEISINPKYANTQIISTGLHFDRA